VLQEKLDHAPYRGVQPGHRESFGHAAVDIEEPARAVPRLDQAVGIEQQPVTRLPRDILPRAAGEGVRRA
jgi:hypothetical protein